MENLNMNSKKWQVQLDVVYTLMSEQLNNEESIGNYTKSRTQKDFDGNDRNKISGPNTKHNIMYRLYQLIDDKSKLCDSCKVLSPLKNQNFTINKEESEHLSLSGKRTKGCVMCDIGGFLNASKGGGTEKRESVINVSDAIADINGTKEKEMHSRLDTSETATDSKDGENGGSTNMIFYEESRNSVYHQSVVIDLDRIAFDDQKQVYVTDIDEIKERIKFSLLSVLHHYLDIRGAKVSVHKPHMLGLEGTFRELTDSAKVNANYSTMNGDYLDVQKLLDSDTKEFKNGSELSNLIYGILDENHMDTLIERNMSVVDNW